MEFLRFGSSIPGSYWGCCAVCIIQNFKVHPDDKASIQLVGGDGGNPIMSKEGKILYAGPTWKDIFLQRLRYGTFGNEDMPNHTFLAVLTSQQIAGEEYGEQWLKLLKEQGFEFIRTVDNSVYTGPDVMTLGETFEVGSEDEYDEYQEEDDEGRVSSHPNYIFGLFRNIGKGAITDPFQPPKIWDDLPSVPHTQEAQLELYNALPKGVFFTQDELEEQKVPVWYAGKRSQFPQQSKQTREITEKYLATATASKAGVAKAPSNPFMSAPLSAATSTF